jgi:hypothetical protein
MGMADAVLSPPAVPVEHRVILNGISWETYGRGKLFTYDSGAPQIAVLPSRHEWPNRVPAKVAAAAAKVLDFGHRAIRDVFLHIRKATTYSSWMKIVRERVKANR